MPLYAVCPRCFRPTRFDKLKDRRKWLCPHCKADAVVSDDLLLEILPKRRLPRWVFLVFLATGMFVVFAAAGLTLKALVK